MLFNLWSDEVSKNNFVDSQVFERIRSQAVEMQNAIQNLTTQNIKLKSEID